MFDFKNIAITSGLLPVAGVLTLFDKKNESFNVVSEESEEPEKKNDKNSVLKLIQYFIFVILFFAAIYLSFKCNNGFHLGDFLIACCCSPCYVIYRLAIPCDQYRGYNYVRRNNIGRMR